MKRKLNIKPKDEFGYWKVMYKSSKHSKWVCQCICGNVKHLSSTRLYDGNTRSCGCKRMERCDGHGHVGTRTYRCYYNMIGRCCNPNNPVYRRYGGAGINVCDKWRNSFKQFLTDMGKCPSNNHSIERIDNSKGYSKENCCWATPYVQSRNNKRNVFITFNGETLVRKDWAKKIGVSECTIKHRLKRGWSLEKALTTGNRSPKERLRDAYTSRKITFRGQTKSLAEWAELTGLTRTCISCRLKRGWSVEKALTTTKIR